ncbi:MAG: arginase [Massilibacillus sp.]|jgi:arginase|nr:arginase [Massilibacillus sp.]
MKKIAIVGAPMWLGQTHFGTSLGPDAIRAAGLVEKLQTISDDIVDVGNITIDSKIDEVESNRGNIKNLATVRDGVEHLAEAVSQMVIEGRFPLVLGGDHSIAIGTLAGIAQHYHNLGVIWYDAHADSNTAEVSPSGNIHGMSLAASVGIGHPDLVQAGGYQKKIRPENVVLIGVRDMDPAEKKIVYDMPIKIFTSEDVKERGIISVVDEAISYLAPKCDGIHLSFDLDVGDPKEICGVGTPVAGGIDFDKNLEAMRQLSHYNVITSAEFVEVNPALDKDGKTVAATLEFIQALLSDEFTN